MNGNWFIRMTLSCPYLPPPLVRPVRIVQNRSCLFDKFLDPITREGLLLWRQLEQMDGRTE